MRKQKPVKRVTIARLQSLAEAADLTAEAMLARHAGKTAPQSAVAAAALLRFRAMMFRYWAERLLAGGPPHRDALRQMQWVANAANEWNENARKNRSIGDGNATPG